MGSKTRKNLLESVAMQSQSCAMRKRGGEVMYISGISITYAGCGVT